MRQAIETAPRTGVCVILEDATQGTFEVARWSIELAQWVDLDGEPVQLNATHWEFPQTVDELVAPGQLDTTDGHPPAPAQGVAATADNPESLTGLNEPARRRAQRGASGIIAAYEHVTAAEVEDNIGVVAAGTGSGGMIGQPRPNAEPAQSMNTGTAAAGLVGSGDGKNLPAIAAAGGWFGPGQRSIVKIGAGLLVGAALAMLATELTADRRQVPPQPSLADSTKVQAAGASESAERIIEELRRAQQQERDKAEKLAAELAQARSRLEAQAKVADEQGRAQQQERDRAEKLAAELAQARSRLEAQAKAADEPGRALQQERDKVEKLAAELAQARSRLEAQAKAADEQGRAQQQERDKAEKLAAELAQARLRLEAQAKAADEQGRAQQQERDKAEKLAAELAQAKSRLEAQAKAADEQGRAQQQERDKAEKLAAELAQAKSRLEAQAKAADEPGRALEQERDKAEKLAAELAQARLRLEAQAKAADEQGRAQQQERDRAEKLAIELAQARLRLEAQAKAADEQGRAQQQERDKAEKLAIELAQARLRLEAQAKAVDEQGRAQQQERDKAEKLAAELAQARSRLEAQAKAVDEQGRAQLQERDKAEKLAAELAQARSRLEAQAKATDEQSRAQQQERDKAEKLAGELVQARSKLEAQTAARIADDAARGHQSAALRDELQKARADAAVAREQLDAERIRREQLEQRLTAIQTATRDGGGRAPAPAAPAVAQPAPVAPSVAPAQASVPTTDVAQPANSPTRSDARVEQGDPAAARLIARANLLLDLGNIGAARNMLDQAAAMGSAEALFWLAATYDPLLLSARKTVGTQGDIAKARELYSRALAGGVSEAKQRLEALRQ